MSEQSCTFNFYGTVHLTTVDPIHQNGESVAQARKAITHQIAHLHITMSDQLDTLTSKLNEAREAAAAERMEVLASFDVIKAKIQANDLTGAIEIADEVIAGIKGVHEAADDEVKPTPETPV